MGDSKERKFTIIDKYDYSKQYDGISIPPRWQLWETAHLYRIYSIIDNPDEPARLISYGCNVHDPNVVHKGENPWPDASHLNCTETCSDAALMYKSPESLWNCMTLATMAMLVVPGDDTIDEASLQEASERFNFGSLEDFNALNVFTDVRECAWASCSDSKYGRCTSSLNRYKCTRISPDNIASFGNVLRRPYCQAADAGIDLDIAGQGVVISYIIQYILVFILGIWFKVVTSWVKKGEYDSNKNATAEPSRWRKTVSENRFVLLVTSTMVDLQEAQALFAAVISVATIAAFTGSSGAGLANILSLFSWIFNHNILMGLITAGMYPVLFVQLLLHERRARWWYTMLLVFLNWILMIVATQTREVDDVGFEEHLQETSAIAQCGGNPGPMSYCHAMQHRENFGFLSITREGRPVVHVITAFLIIDWIICFWRDWRKQSNKDIPDLRQQQSHRIKSTNKIKTLLDKVKNDSGTALWIVWSLMQLLTFAMMVVSLYELVQLLGLHTGEDAPSWSFGQLVAVAVWLPVIFKLASLALGKSPWMSPTILLKYMTNT